MSYNIPGGSIHQKTMDPSLFRHSSTSNHRHQKQQQQQQQRSASNSVMSTMNQRQRKSLFQHLEARTVARSRPNQASLYPPHFSQATESSTRASVGVAVKNHYHHLMQNNNDMSQISQLSMDSSFGNSQSTNNNFADNSIPLRQPSVSMASHSSASSTGQQRYNTYQPLVNHNPTFDLHNGNTSTSSNCIRNNDASSGDHQIKSSLQKKKRPRNKKTRFASATPGDGGVGGVGTHSMSQTSFDATSSSFSAPASKSSNGSHHSSDGHQARNHQQRKHITTLNDRRGVGGTLSRSGTDYSRILLTRKCHNNQRTSPPKLLQDPTFAKAATPRRRCNVLYPPLESEKKHHHELRLQQQQQQQQQQQIHKHCVGIKIAAMASSNMTEERDQEPFTSRHNEGQEDTSNEIHLQATGSICNVNQQYVHKGKENEQQLVLRDSKGESGVDPTTAGSDYGEVSGPFSSQQTNVANTDTAVSLVSVEQKRQQLLNEVEILEARKKENTKDIETRLVMEVQKQLEDRKLELFTKMQLDAAVVGGKVTQKVLQECEAMANAAERRLDQKAISIQEATILKLDQKQNEIEKKLKATASSFLEKLEVSVDGGLAKLSSFTETWTTNIKPLVAQLLASLLSSSSSSAASAELSSGKSTLKKRDTAIGPVADEQQPQKKRRLEGTSTDRESIGRSQMKGAAGCSSPSIFEAAVSLTQGSRHSGVGKASVQLRRSKREKNKSVDPIKEDYRPVTKEKRMKKLVKNEKNKKEYTYHNSGKKKMMVTPPAKKSSSAPKKAFRPRRKKKIAEIQEVKVAPATTENQELKFLQKAKIPSEIITTSAFELSPIKDVFVKSNSKCITVSRSKKKSFSKRKDLEFETIL